MLLFDRFLTFYFRYPVLKCHYLQFPDSTSHKLAKSGKWSSINMMLLEDLWRGLYMWLIFD